MKDNYIINLNSGDEITSYFLVKDKSLRTDSRGKQYLDLQLGDKTGEIAAKKWDIADSELDAVGRIARGSIIKVRAAVTEWNGGKQLKILKIRHTGPEDGLDKNDYFKAAPEDAGSMFEYISSRADAISDADFRAVAQRVLKDNEEKLQYYPAASKNHHAEYAGLLWHMKRMLMMAERMTEVYDFLNPDILFCGVIIHDIEKIKEMNSDENGIVSEYTFEGVLLGHLVQGAALIAMLAKELGLPDEKKIMLEHMMISHHYEPEFGSPRKPVFPEAEALHYLDMLDAKMYDFEAALAPVSPGGFTDRVWTLDNRKLYKRTF
ncbi:MAG: HD domain-containing protein [Clostridiales Family XIII bacterium]|jgi:3'-5' exoribonuclease|nr:HD domain-containing protein [Clostridiales Family XIII bacterium]